MVATIAFVGDASHGQNPSILVNLMTNAKPGRESALSIRADDIRDDYDLLNVSKAFLGDSSQ